MENSIKHYTMTLLINGLIALVFGALAVSLPKEIIITIAMYFGILMLVGGAGGLWLSISNMKHEKPYISALISSVISIVVGLIIVLNPGFSLKIFGTIIGIWALVIGAVQLFIALKLLEPGTSKKLLIISSALTFIFGLLLFISPFGYILVLTRIIGVMAIIFGGLMLFFSFSLRKAE